MAVYTIPQILVWAHVSQPLARIGEANKLRKGDTSADLDLDMKIYDTIQDVQYSYNQNEDAAIQYAIGDYLYALCFPYMLQAQASTTGGGNVTPVVPGTAPDPYDFVVNASTSFILDGATSKMLPSNWAGFNILLVINGLTQSIVDDGETACYTWDKATAELTFIHRTIATGDLIQIYPFA